MTTETKPWRNQYIEESYECYRLIDSDDVEVATFFNADEAERLTDRLNALEACAEALRKVMPIAWFGASSAASDGIGETQVRCEDATAALARLDALRP